MKTVRPDFYDDFKCIADKCRHSCCIGWEIDIDSDSYEYYMGIEGKLGEDLRKNISADPEPHFCLCENERCPFLECNGLCRLINELGEESLCDICAEHPRFYNYFDDREEMGLGLSCEEVARLLLEGNGSLQLISDEEWFDEDEVVRQDIFEILADNELKMSQRFRKALDYFHEDFQMHDLSLWAEFFLKLERLDEAWTEKLLLLKEKGKDLELDGQLQHIRYQRLCQYFVYRHMLEADEYAPMLEFCILATEIIAALDLVCGFDIEHTRLFSSEIEYSDENIGIILEEIQKTRE